MNKAEILSKVEELLESGQMVRCYFKDFTRAPIYGKFVIMSDHKELMQRGMVRFVTDGQLKNWEEDQWVIFTKLLSIDNFNYFKTF